MIKGWREGKKDQRFWGICIVIGRKMGILHTKIPPPRRSEEEFVCTNGAEEINPWYMTTGMDLWICYSKHVLPYSILPGGLTH